MRVACLPLLPGLVIGCATSVAPDDPAARAREQVRRFERLEQHRLAGKLVVVQGDKVLVQRGFGTMAAGDPRPIDPEAVMPLASVTRPITASAMLALGDAIGQYLPGLAGQWAEVPIQHVLMHTAGLPAEIVDRNWPGAARFEPIGRGTLIERINRFRPDHVPGAGFNHSNAGYNLLAALIDVISGRSLEKFVAELLLAPAGKGCGRVSSIGPAAS